MGYFTDCAENHHHRQQAEHYVKTRASQGFNVIHSMLLSEQGVGNQNGLPSEEISAERMNPAYWQEVDFRLAFANRQGLTVGLAPAWGDKRKVEPFAGAGSQGSRRGADMRATAPRATARTMHAPESSPSANSTPVPAQPRRWRFRISGQYKYQAPDEQDGVMVLEAAGPK